MLCLLALTMGVKLFGERGNAASLVSGAERKRERIEASQIAPARAIFERATGTKRPQHMNPTRKHAQRQCIVMAKA